MAKDVRFDRIPEGVHNYPVGGASADPRGCRISPRGVHNLASRGCKSVRGGRTSNRSEAYSYAQTIVLISLFNLSFFLIIVEKGVFLKTVKIYSKFILNSVV